LVKNLILSKENDKNKNKSVNSLKYMYYSFIFQFKYKTILKTIPKYNLKLGDIMDVVRFFDKVPKKLTIFQKTH